MINNDIIFSVINNKFECNDLIFNSLALSNSEKPNTLTFLDDSKFLDQINTNEFITGVITNLELSSKIINKNVLVTDCPRFDFFSLFNKVSNDNYINTKSKIAASARINSRAYVSEFNVEIGENTIIEPNATILPDVRIGDNCIVRAGTVIGSEGFEYKRTSKGILPVFHDGKVIIGNNVEIGANTCIDKGFSFKNTIIEDEVKIDNLVHIAHGVLIKKGAFIIAGTILGGSSTIGEDSWVSINASIAPGVKTKSKSFVSMGAVVTRDVEENQQVTGNIAIDHKVFLKIFKKNLHDNSI